MLSLNQKIIITGALIVSLLIVMRVLKLSVKKYSLLESINANRRKVILNLNYFVLYLLVLVGLGIVWGVNLNQLTVVVSSVLAVLGVGFFAQWSILSNLTASVILFFYHPVRIGDRIRFLDKDLDFVGTVTDITGFFFYMETDEGKHITFPNNVILQKGIEILKPEAGS